MPDAVDQFEGARPIASLSKESVKTWVPPPGTGDTLEAGKRNEEGCKRIVAPGGEAMGTLAIDDVEPTGGFESAAGFDPEVVSDGEPVSCDPEGIVVPDPPLHADAKAAQAQLRAAALMAARQDLCVMFISVREGGNADVTWP